MPGRVTQRRVTLGPFVLGAALGTSGCFDSDDKFKVAPVDTTGESTGIVDPTTSTGTPPVPSTTDGGTSTCRDAIDCVNACIFSIQMQIIMDVPEPSLECFLECDTTLSVEEALLLLRLFECAYQRCSSPDGFTDANGEPLCSEEMMSETTTGGSSSSDGGSSSSDGGSSSSTGEPPPPPPPPPPSPLDPCTTCVITVVQDESECPDLQAMCQ